MKYTFDAIYCFCITLVENFSREFFHFAVFAPIDRGFYSPNMNAVNVTADKAMDAHQ